jgi:branched-chain amino acid transport system substrate-binding protein
MFSGTVGPSLPNFAKQLGDTAEYVFGFSSWEPLPDVLKHPGMKEFVAKYEKRFGEMPNYHAGSTYGALQVTEAAVKKAGTFDSQKLRDAFASIEVTTVFGRYKVDGKGMNQIDGLTFQILKGQRRIVYPEELAEMPAKLPIPQWAER